MFSFVVRSVKSHALFMNWLLFQHVTRTSTTMRWWPININWMLLRNICQKGRGKKYDIQIEQQLQLKLFALYDELLSEPQFTVGYDTKTNASTWTTTQFYPRIFSGWCECNTYHLWGAGASIPNRQTPSSARNHENRTDWAMVHRHQSQLHLLRVLSKRHLVPLKCFFFCVSLGIFNIYCVAPSIYASCLSCTAFIFQPS